MSKINLYDERDFSKNLEITFAFLKQNYAVICKMLVYFIPLLLIAAYLQPNTSNPESFSIQTLDDIYEMITPGFIMSYVISVLVSFTGSVCIICYFVVYSQSEDEKINVSQVWIVFKQNFFPILGAGILFSLVSVIGFVLCIIPGIIVSVFLCMYAYCYLIEKGSIMDSLKSSWALVKGEWWNTFLFLFLIALFVMIVSGLFAIPSIFAPIGAVAGIDFFLSDTYFFVSTSISYIGSFFVMPLTYTAIGVLYFSLKAKKEKQNNAIDSIGNSNF